MRPDDARVRRGVVPGGAPRVALGIRCNRAQQQWHAVVVYCAGGDAPRCLHLADDLDLRDQPLDDPRLGWSRHYAWVELRLAEEHARTIAQVCRRVARTTADRGQQVRYSIRHHLGRFDEATGAYIPAQGERGLTCATCALALCRGAGVELVDVASWPARPDDGPWIERVVAGLRGRDPVHADAVAADGLCARFRPTEVVGAALADALPVAFAEAVQLAEALRDRYDAIFPPPDL